MDVKRRTSGGRGEYELSGDYRGVRAVDIQNLEFRIVLPGLRIPTGVTVKIADGKPRLRALQKGVGIQLHRQLAALLLMPPPVRENSSLSGGWRILRLNGYAIDRAEVVELETTDATADLRFGQLSIVDSDYEDALSVSIRFSRVRALWSRADTFPPAIRDALNAHRAAVLGGTALNEAVETHVRQIFQATDGDPLGAY